MINKTFTISDQIFFAQRLSLLIDSGVSLLESLKVLRSMDNSKRRSAVYDVLIENCGRGISLSKSINQSNTRFDPLLITLIKNGEYSGSLATVLLQASISLEKRNELMKKTISTLIYPSFIFIATICMALFLVLYIFPKILPMLGSMNIELPLLTRIVKILYELSISYGLIIIISIFILVSIFIFLLKKFSYIKYKTYSLLLITPLYSTYLKLSILGSICANTDMLLSSGRSLSESHIFTIESINNLVYREAIMKIHSESLQGVSFSKSMKKYPKLFLQVMIDMCSLGERTGDLSTMLGHCSRIFEQELDTYFKRFSSLIEPVLMIFMGLIVGSIALSIILPVYEITNHLTK